MEKIYTPEEIAELLQIPKQTVWKFIQEGKLNAHKVGKHYRITESEFKEFMAATYTVINQITD
jgi:excisionase family DNA binding protein